MIKISLLSPARRNEACEHGGRALCTIVYTSIDITQQEQNNKYKIQQEHLPQFWFSKIHLFEILHSAKYTFPFRSQLSAASSPVSVHTPFLQYPPDNYGNYLLNCGDYYLDPCLLGCILGDWCLAFLPFCPSTPGFFVFWLFRALCLQHYCEWRECTCSCHS